MYCVKGCSPVEALHTRAVPLTSDNHKHYASPTVKQTPMVTIMWPWRLQMAATSPRRV